MSRVGWAVILITGVAFYLVGLINRNGGAIVAESSAGASLPALRLLSDRHVRSLYGGSNKTPPLKEDLKTALRDLRVALEVLRSGPIPRDRRSFRKKVDCRP